MSPDHLKKMLHSGAQFVVALTSKTETANRAVLISITSRGHYTHVSTFLLSVCTLEWLKCTIVKAYLFWLDYGNHFVGNCLSFLESDIYINPVDIKRLLEVICDFKQDANHSVTLKNKSSEQNV